MKYFKLFENNEIRKHVYRGGSEKGSEFYEYATYYTDDYGAALNYANEMHGNDMVIEKDIHFENPLILKKYDPELYDIMYDIFKNDYDIPTLEIFPYSLNDTHRVEIIKYARENGYDGIVMDDTTYYDDDKITSYIEL